MCKNKKYKNWKKTNMNFDKFVYSMVDNVEQLTEASEVKVKTILSAGPSTMILNKDCKFLNIGTNYLGHGLRKLGYDCVDCDTDPGQLLAAGETFDYVIAADEWLTLAETEDEQREKLAMLAKLCHVGFFTTIKDYKNMTYNQRTFYEPFQLKISSGDAILLKHRKWNPHDRQQWTEVAHVIKDKQLVHTSQCIKRTMYFKQLAKFTSDIGSKNFQVEKKLMYKSLFSKNQDYIVYISF